METENKYPKLSDFFKLINEAHAELQKMLPELCELCGKPAWECECEDPYSI
jgi:hypothetical protein